MRTDGSTIPQNTSTIRQFPVLKPQYNNISSIGLAARAARESAMIKSNLHAMDDLWSAARRGDAQAVERMLKHDVDVEANDECVHEAMYYSELYAASKKSAERSCGGDRVSCHGCGQRHEVR